MNVNYINFLLPFPPQFFRHYGAWWEVTEKSELCSWGSVPSRLIRYLLTLEISVQYIFKKKPHCWSENPTSHSRLPHHIWLKTLLTQNQSFSTWNMNLPTVWSLPNFPPEMRLILFSSTNACRMPIHTWQEQCLYFSVWSEWAGRFWQKNVMKLQFYER